MAHIVRIDSASTHGWQARAYTVAPHYVSQLFSDGQHGSKAKAYAAALANASSVQRKASRMRRLALAAVAAAATATAQAVVVVPPRAPVIVPIRPAIVPVRPVAPPTKPAAPGLRAASDAADRARDRPAPPDQRQQPERVRSQEGRGLQGDAMSFDLVQHLRRQIAFSLATFGPGDRTEGVVDHITKELAEVLQSGGALDEGVASDPPAHPRARRLPLRAPGLHGAPVFRGLVVLR